MKLKPGLICSLVLIGLANACASPQTESTPTPQGTITSTFEFTAIPTPIEDGQDKVKKLDDYLSRLAGIGFTGSVFVSQGNEILVSKGYGDNITPDTLFAIGSNSKIFTSAAILSLQDAGQLNLDDKLSNFFDGVPEDKQTITIEQLLTHSSGFDHSGIFPQNSKFISNEESVDLILSSPLLFRAGKDISYSDAGYILLAAIIEKVSGQDFQEYVRTTLLEPAEISNTGWVGETDFLTGKAIASGSPNSEIQDILSMPEPSWSLLGAGGMVSTVNDLYRWHQAIENGKILSAKSIELYSIKHFPKNGTSGEGFGWSVTEFEEGRHVRASAGGTPELGHSNMMVWWKEDNVLFIVNSNNNEFKAEGITPNLRAIVFGQEYLLPPKVFESEIDEIEAFEGNYFITENEGHFIIEVSEESLVLYANDNNAFMELFPNQNPRITRSQNAVTNFLQQQNDPEFELLEKWKRKQELKYGGYKSNYILGTTSLGGGELWTYVGFEFESGTAFTRWAVGPQGGLLGVVYDAELPFLKFYPVSENKFISYSLDAQTSYQITFNKTNGTMNLVTDANSTIAERKDI